MGAEQAGSREKVITLGEVLERVEAKTKEREQVAIGDVVEALGRRAFAPLLLVPGLVMLAPVVGDIPGVPVIMGLLVILVAGQLIVDRRELWLPDWLANRSVSCSKVQRTLRWLYRPAGFVDRWTKPRLTWAVRHAGFYVVAVSCIVVSAATPVMEFVPFSANIAGLAITTFALSLTARDGLLALVAVAFVVAAVAVVVWQLV